LCGPQEGRRESFPGSLKKKRVLYRKLEEGERESFT
jgi:hypothetical protein